VVDKVLLIDMILKKRSWSATHSWECFDYSSLDEWSG